jgi:hypothetical protein
MGYKRAIIQEGGLSRAARAGDTSDNPVVTLIATDAAASFLVAQIAAGVVAYTGFTAGRILTTDTAANILAAYPEMDIGDSLHIKVASTAAFAATWSAGAGVTIAGRATVPASTGCDVYITKMSATTVNWTTI